ncbi:MAG: response regulator [Candidatus Tectimicrobiota bacterium]|nr:MAG: response regulator [Candidatus Tectomicrobia bacterium]
MPDVVLLVEDDANDVLLVELAWQRVQPPAQLQVVRNGDAAIAYLSGRGAYADRQRYPLPVLVLLDLQLPGRSGFEVLAWLRQQARLRRLPVMVFTSSGEAGDVNRAYDLGANAYLVKPATLAALVDLVQVLAAHWLRLVRRPEVA